MKKDFILNRQFSRRRFIKSVSSVAAASIVMQNSVFGKDRIAFNKNEDDDILKQFKCPQWFKDVKFGLWLHWGPQTIPAKGAGWYARHLYMHPNDKRHENFGREAWEYHRVTFGHQADFGYKDICNLWKAEKFDAEETVRLFKKWGARYVAIIANHHDNYDLFKSSVHGWNSTRVGPMRDIVGEFASAARRNSMKWVATTHTYQAKGFYDGAFGADESGPRKGEAYDGRLTKSDGKCAWWNGLDPQQLYAGRYPDFYREYVQRLTELVENYKPDMLYFDNYEIPDPAVDVCRKFYSDSLKRNGAIENIVTVKKPQVGTILDFEKGIAEGISAEYWQTDTSMNEDWFLKPEGDDNSLHHNERSLKELLVDIVSKRGCLLLNVAVNADGSIPADQYAILEKFGEWLQANGEAIYGTIPWKVYGDGGKSASGNFNERRASSDAWDCGVHRFTCSKDGKTLYIHVFGNPAGREISFPSLGNRELFRGKVKKVGLIGGGSESLKWSMGTNGLTVRFPDRLAFEDCNVLRVITNGL